MCGVTLREPSKCARDDLGNDLKDEALEKMIAKDLSAEEREDFKVMLRKHPSLFIFYYSEVSGVTIVQHQINLKPNIKPVAQKL